MTCVDGTWKERQTKNTEILYVAIRNLVVGDCLALPALVCTGQSATRLPLLLDIPSADAMQSSCACLLGGVGWYLRYDLTVLDLMSSDDT